MKTKKNTTMSINKMFRTYNHMSESLGKVINEIKTE